MTFYPLTFSFGWKLAKSVLRELWKIGKKGIFRISIRPMKKSFLSKHIYPRTQYLTQNHVDKSNRMTLQKKT